MGVSGRPGSGMSGSSTMSFRYLKACSVASREAPGSSFFALEKHCVKEASYWEAMLGAGEETMERESSRWEPGWGLADSQKKPFLSLGRYD